MAATTFQYAVPVADVGTSAWSPSPAWPNVDEPPPFNDSDIIGSPANTPGAPFNYSVEFQLSTATNSAYFADGWAALVRAQKNSAAGGQSLTVDLINAGSVLATWNQPLTTTMTTYSLALTPTEAAAVPSGAYAGGWSLRLTAQQPSTASNSVVVSGCCLQLPTLGYAHLDIDPSGVGLKVVGAHAGAYLIREVSGVGFKRMAGSEASGALILDAAGAIKVHA
jgi:hypothetical protein